LTIYTYIYILCLYSKHESNLDEITLVP